MNDKQKMNKEKTEFLSIKLFLNREIHLTNPKQD